MEMCTKTHATQMKPAKGGKDMVPAIGRVAKSPQKMNYYNERMSHNYDRAEHC